MSFLISFVSRPDSALYLNMSPQWPGGGRRGLRTHRYTFVIQRRRDGRETHILHDNQTDPYQTRNVADETPVVFKQLTNDLIQWLEKTDDPWLKEG